MKSTQILIALGALVIPALAVAQQAPHPAAIAACRTKSEGDGCQFEGHHGTHAGTCRKVGSDLACVHPHHH
jgi:hypothetical protein